MVDCRAAGVPCETHRDEARRARGRRVCVPTAACAVASPAISRCSSGWHSFWLTAREGQATSSLRCTVGSVGQVGDANVSRLATSATRHRMATSRR
jgi:hypothetical protein